MKLHFNQPTLSILLLISIINTSCKKFLEEKPDKTLSIPTSIAEMQGLLDRGDNNLGFPIASELADDNLYFPSASYKALFFPHDRGTYIWDPTTDLSKDWTSSYRKVFTANVVLSELTKPGKYPENTNEYNNAKGSALFFRAYNFYELAQLFSPAYSSQSADLELGIPLRTLPDIEAETRRSTVKETYEKIISDTKESVRMLPAVPIVKTRPGKVTAYALLARTYLSMSDYTNALKYADSSWKIYSELLDYNNINDVDPFANASFKQFNKEVIFHAIASNIFEIPSSRVDSFLYNSYDTNDLRKSAFFLDNIDGTYTFKGNYSGQPDNRGAFCGITSSEILLIRAECRARTGLVAEAIDDLNTLLVKRWLAGTFTSLSATTPQEVLAKILIERRKELCFRPSIRWSDLRRLNLDSNYAVTLQRALDGQLYTLDPNDVRYVFLIPPSVIQSSGINQNPR